MDDFVGQFFTVSTVVFALVIWVLVLLQRKVVDVLLPKLATTKIWLELILPFLPVIMGGVIALVVKKYPFPETFSVSASSRLFFGVVCGLFSGLVYRVVKAFILQKLPKKDGDEKADSQGKLNILGDENNEK